MVTAFDAGRRHAVSDQAQAAYDQSVANYRETVLGAFQDVEDNLAALRILQDEAKTQQAAVQAAQNSLNLSLTRYKGGVTTYLEVITAQGLALSDERTAVQILGRRITASVLLVRALGGGWDSSTLPQRPECCGRLISQSQRSGRAADPKAEAAPGDIRIPMRRRQPLLRLPRNSEPSASCRSALFSAFRGDSLHHRNRPAPTAFRATLAECVRAPRPRE